MKILEGPFLFGVDDTGRTISWNELDEHIRSELTAEGRHSEADTNVYFCKVNVISAGSSKGKNHDWSKVKRVFVDVKPSNKSISIFGVSPRNRKERQVHQSEMVFEGTVQGSVKLFEVFQTSIEIKGPFKGVVGQNQFAVVSTFARGYAQWIFTEKWDEIEFQLFMYVAVPNSLDVSERFIELYIYPTLKKFKRVDPGYCHKRVAFQ